MITLFTTFRQHRGEFALIQRTALDNWKMLGAEIIVFGREAALIAWERRFAHIPNVIRNEYGLPILSSMISVVEGLLERDVMMYTNADIIFYGLEEAIETVAGQLDEFLIVGQRRDYPGPLPINFSEGWQDELLAQSTLHPPHGEDYFIFTPGMWEKIPPMAVACCAFDNWLVADAIARGKPVVDATDAILAFHLNHAQKRSYRSAEVKDNRKLALQEGYNLREEGHTVHTPWVLNSAGLQRRER